MARDNGSRDRDSREIALEYIRWGYSVVPVPPNSKAPNIPGWQDLRLAREDVPRYFNNDANIGVLLGEPSNGLVDVDLDTPEAEALAPYFLSISCSIFGHPARPRSHWLYWCKGARPRKYSLPNGGVLIELRSTGQMTIFPGSLYAGNKGERGSLIEWYEVAPPMCVVEDDLTRALGRLAATTLLVKEWEPGVRDELATAVTGCLLRAKWPVEDVEHFIKAVTTVAGDEDGQERVRKVQYHHDRLAEDRGNVPGWPRLVELLDQAKVRRLQEWLEILPLGPNPGGGRRRQPSAAEVADMLLDEGCYARDAGDQLYVSTGGCYRSGDRPVKVAVKQILCERLQAPQRWSSHFGDEVVRAMVFDGRVPLLWESPPLDTLNLKNGLLDVRSQVLRPHAPGFLSPVQLNVAFDPEAKGEYWERYVADWFPGDAQTLAWEIVAYLMLPIMHLQKALYLFNESGANGKSRYIGGLTNFLGDENVSHIKLQSLEDNRFASSGLMGKLVNAYADLPSTRMMGSSTFKAITGGDPIDGERKYGAAFSFRPFARLLFSGNGLPESADASDAFFRRWHVIRFPRHFPEGRKRISALLIDKQLARENEKSWLLNKALAVVQKVIEQGLSTPHSVRTEIKEFQAATDPVAIWLDGHAVREPGASVPCGDLLAAFNEYATDNDLPRQTKQGFGTAVKRHFQEVGVKTRTVRSKPRVKCYIGIGLKIDETKF